ncbi:RHS repeat protein, partial [Methylibium rhizosphaerae]|uniref:RHS repeat protein n=1 Tax=Methylibium rhizosphaerae TaxID=2570323 RepID=UPI00112E28F8
EYVYDGGAAYGQRTDVAARTITYGYNAFGEVEGESRLNNSTGTAGEWATTRHYYDRMGRNKATVDALGYLTEREYDAVGNLASVIEYEHEASYDQAGRPVSPVSAKDRKTSYGYDRVNRKVSETQVAAEVYDSASQRVVERELITRFAYDAVGNLVRTTDAHDASTFSYYDALGRVTAVVGAAFSEGMDEAGSVRSVSPVTEFARDAHGNVLVKIEHKYGATAVSESGYTVVAPGARYTRTQYDSHGRAIEVRDAEGRSTYSSYDRAGRLAKQWQSVTNGDGVLQTTYKVFVYDALGRQVDLIEPGSQGTVRLGVTAPRVQSAVGSRVLRWREGVYEIAWSNPQNTVELAWSGLIDAHGGNVRVDLGYQTLIDHEARIYRSPELLARDVSGGATLTWPETQLQDGGIAGLSTVVVSQKDASGDWIVMYRGPVVGSAISSDGSGATPVHQRSEFNAFGELVTRRVDDGRAVDEEQVEYFKYDNAGRVWMTNEGDGVDKVYLYDVQGRRTAVISSAQEGA